MAAAVMQSEGGEHKVVHMVGVSHLIHHGVELLP